MAYAETHIERCNRAAKQDSEAVFRAIFLASSSIRIHSKKFWTKIAPKAYQTYLENDRDIYKTSPKVGNFCAMKSKSDCISYAEENKADIYKNFKELSPEDFYLWLIKNVPGLGPAKAAFVSQMTNGFLGCLDTVNLKRLDVPRNATRTGKKYIETFFAIGESSPEMWETWCEHVADRDGFNSSALSLAHSLFVENGGYDPAELIK